MTDERERRKHAEEEARKKPPDPGHLDPDYLEHNDEAEILKTMRDEQMRPHKFPT